MRIESIVTHNSGFAFVLDEEPEFIYEKHGDLLIGTDQSGIFLDILYFSRSYGTNQAFGGTEFTLNMKDGSTIFCAGQWWSGGQADAEKILGIDIRDVVIGTKEKLQQCFVFTGCSMDYHKMKNLIQEYIRQEFKGYGLYTLKEEDSLSAFAYGYSLYERSFK